MADPSTEAATDPVATRDEALARGLLGEADYARAVPAAVAHAAKPRPGPALPPWVGTGPRNIGGRILSLVQDSLRPLTLYAGSAHGGLWRTQDAGDSWAHIDLGANSFNGPVGALALHARDTRKLYLGTGAVEPNSAAGDGLFRLTFQDNGALVMDRLASAPGQGEAPQASANGAAARYTRIEVDPDEPERFWAASNTGLWRGHAAGAPVVVAWVRDFPLGVGVPANAPNLFAQTGTTLESRFPAYITDVRVARDPRSSETVLRPDGRRLLRFLVVYAAVQEAGVFRGRYDRSLDTMTWDAQRTLVPNAPDSIAFARVLLALCRSRPASLYCVFETFDDGSSRASRIVASEDSGDSWTLRGRIPDRDNNQAFFSMVLEVDPDDARILVCGTVNLALSSDGGANFKPILEWEHYDQGDHAQHADQHALVFDVLDRRRLWVGNDGGISLARNLSRSDGAAFGYWRKRSHGISAGQFQDVTVHPAAALNFISAGGLQDNGSWVGYGGTTWYHIGPADGGGIAVHAGNPRQFLISQQSICTLGTVTAALPAAPDAPPGPGVDLVTRIPAVQLFTISARVLNDLPLPDPVMRVRRDRYLPGRRLNEAGLAGPFVGMLEQDPRPANAGQALYGFTFGNVGAEPAAAPLLHRTAALVLLPPPAPAALPATPATLPAPPASASELPLALLQRVVLPAPALALGDEASAIAFGPNPGAAPPLVEGWLGTARGRVMHTNDAPLGPPGNLWADVTQLSTPSSAGAASMHAALRFAVHPANPAIVAAAALPADREFFISIATAGAPADAVGGAARYQAEFINPNGGAGPLQPPAAANAAFTALAGTGLFLSFPDAAYTLAQSWRISLNGEVLPRRRLFAFGRLPAQARIAITAPGGPHQPNTPGGAVGVPLPGTAQYQVEFRAGAGFAPAVAAGDCEFRFARMLNTTMLLRFTSAAYAAGESWLVDVDGRVRPAATLNVLTAFNRALDIVIVAAGALGAATFSFQPAGLPVQAPALRTGAAVELPGAGVVLHFSGGPFVAGHHWRIEIDNRVAAVGAVVGNVEVLARLRGRVFLSHDRGLNWTDASFPRTRPPAGFDADTAALPPGPITSLRFDAQAAGTDLYVGTLAGVYAAPGVPLVAPVAPAVLDLHWRPFNGPAGQALPATLVNDLELVSGTRRLRAATFGRGLWDCDLANALPQRQLVIRQTLVEDGLAYPRPFPFPAALPDDPRLPAATVWLDHAHAFDIRVDTAPFKFFDDAVDGVEFDEELGVDVLQPLARQAVYVQVHNRGWDAVNDVDVHLLFAPAGVDGSLPMAPAVVAAPATAMPALAAAVAEIDALGAPGFNPAGASPWRRVAVARRVPLLRPWEPVVLRFDWQPPAALAVAAPNNHVALLALCTAADDAMPLPAAGEKLPAFIARERRAALRLVPIASLPAASLSIRDGVDDDARAGGVAFVGRSPDLIAVPSAPTDPAAAFADLLDTRPADSLRLNAGNEVYVRVHNSGLAAATAEVHLWAVPLDGLQAPSFAPGTWLRLTPAAAPFLSVAVPAGGTALAHQAWANPPDPAPASPLKAIALVALIRSSDDSDPLPDPTTAGVITSVQLFWDFFDKPFNADNAALRVLPVRG